MARIQQSAINDAVARWKELGWVWGVDFSKASCKHVIAINVNRGDLDNKYDMPWIGPVPVNDECLAMLSVWAERKVMWGGGYVHLLPADTSAVRDGLKELREWFADVSQE